MVSVNLQSQAHKDLLDIIDNLRSQGISRYVDLPEIIVTGDQSAGKSSVLEAISGMSFPTKDNLCTRFATELVLRRAPLAQVKVSISPDAERPAAEQEVLKLFGPAVDIDNPNLGDVIESAKEAMGLIGTMKVFSNDTLRVEMSGPEQPHLTLVDLPGLFQAGNSSQSDEDAELVTNMVLRYMKRPRSIILAVVSAKSDFALQKVTRLARELDPTGDRTLGLITKPDTLDAGSESETAYFQLAQNKDVKFRLGWHVLKNRDYKMRNSTSVERDIAEAEFFSKGIWSGLEHSHMGVGALKPRLSNVLKDQILLQLPSLLNDVSSGIEDCNERLAKLGKPREDVRQQRRYLLQASQEFSQLMKAAIDGIYSHPFFGNADDDADYKKRLRAVVQNIFVSFTERMDEHGKTREIVDAPNEDSEPLEANEITRENFIDEVKVLIRRSRGCELAGTFNPLIVGELFAAQCRPWKLIAADLKEEILEAVDSLSAAIIRYVVTEDTAGRILQVVKDGIHTLKTEMDDGFQRVFQPYQKIHPITYNHYLTENVQKAQARRRKDAVLAELNLRYGQDANGDIRIKPEAVLSLLDLDTDKDMEAHGSSLAVDYMEAFYKVALKKFIDDVSTLAVECCLIQHLPSVFDPEKIYDMSDEQIASLAAENEGCALERARVTEKLAILQTAHAELRRLDTFRPMKTEASHNAVQTRERGERNKRTWGDQWKFSTEGRMDEQNTAENMWTAFDREAFKKAVWGGRLLGKVEVEPEASSEDEPRTKKKHRKGQPRQEEKHKNTKKDE